MRHVDECVRLIQSCRHIAEARHVHSQISRSSAMASDGVFLSNLLIRMFGVCSSVRDALAVFLAMPIRNSCSWRQTLFAFLDSRDFVAALAILERMPKSDVVSSTAMVAAAAKLGDLNLAEMIFGRMEVSNEISWNTMLTAYAKHGKVREIEDLFDRMPARGIVSWTIFLTAHAQRGNSFDSKRMFEKMPQWNVVSFNTELSSLAKAGRVDSSKLLFDSMPERSHVSWVSLLVAYSHRHLKDTLAVLRAIPSYDVVSWTIVLDACFASGADEADRFFHVMQTRNLISWNTMLGGYSQLADVVRTRRVFDLMPARDMVSWTTLLTATAYGKNIQGCKRIFADMPCQDVASETAMLGAYALAGNLGDAEGFFSSMGVRNVVSWTSMIGAYAKNGRFRGALDAFRAMNLDGIKPNGISFCCVLLGCSHGGMLSDGWECFRSMAGDHGLRPLKEHYGCMVDLLSRAGRLQQAEDLIWSMPFFADEVEWTSILGGCQLHKDSVRANVCAVILRSQTCVYPLLANICSQKDEH